MGVMHATRRELLVRSAAATAVLCGCSELADAAQAATTANSDAAVLRFALRLEQLQASLLGDKARTVKLADHTRFLAHVYAAHEQTHVMAVATALSDLGVSAAKPATATFASVTDEASFLRAAISLENTAVGSYNGLLATLHSKVALAQMGAILQVDARHAAAFELRARRSPTPDGAFDTAISRSHASGRIARLGG